MNEPFLNIAFNKAIWGMKSIFKRGQNWIFVDLTLRFLVFAQYGRFRIVLGIISWFRQTTLVINSFTTFALRFVSEFWVMPINLYYLVFSHFLAF